MKLHEKKISELIQNCYENDVYPNADTPAKALEIIETDLKQWAIDKIKNCKNESYPNPFPCGTKVIDPHPSNPDYIARCQSCQDRIHDHELTGEDV